MWSFSKDSSYTFPLMPIPRDSPLQKTFWKKVYQIEVGAVRRAINHQICIFDIWSPTFFTITLSRNSELPTIAQWKFPFLKIPFQNSKTKVEYTDKKGSKYQRIHQSQLLLNFFQLKPSSSKLYLICASAAPNSYYLPWVLFCAFAADFLTTISSFSVPSLFRVVVSSILFSSNLGSSLRLILDIEVIVGLSPPEFTLTVSIAAALFTASVAMTGIIVFTARTGFGVVLIIIVRCCFSWFIHFKIGLGMTDDVECKYCPKGTRP